MSPIDRVFLTCFMLLMGCAGFSIGDDDAGPALDGGIDAASLLDSATERDAGDSGDAGDAGDARDAADVGPPPDGGPCTTGEPCDDGDACTEGETCGESGCGGGTAVVCAGNSARCDVDDLVRETRSGVCEPATGCVVETQTTFCPFSCADAMCTACSATPWSQTPLPLPIDESALPTTRFVVDDAGGQHIVFPTRRMGPEFLDPAVDYAYRPRDGAAWTVTGFSPTNLGGAGISLAVHNEEPHILVIVEDVITYWHRDGATWVDEVVPGRGYRGLAEIVVTDDGAPHVLRAGLSALAHLQRSGGVWTEEPIDLSIRSARTLRAEAQGLNIHLVFGDGNDALGYAHFSGSAWTTRREVMGDRVVNPQLSVGADGTVDFAFALDDMQELILASLTPGGVFSAFLITDAIPQIGDEHAVARDDSGGTHVVFRTILSRAVHYGYRAPGSSFVSFSEIVADTAFAFNLFVDARGKLRMVSEHILPISGTELRFSERQTCP